jgi:hypothetical protein
MVYNVAGHEFVEEFDFLVVEDLFEEPFDHDLVVLYRHSFLLFPRRYVHSYQRSGAPNALN